jgi:hypothetical protein
VRAIEVPVARGRSGKQRRLLPVVPKA